MGGLPCGLPDIYITSYHEIRKLRNKVTHQGEAKQAFNPSQLVDMMVSQYLSLWPNQKWLVDRVAHASNTRHAFFHDGRYSSAEYEVMDELGQTFHQLTKGKFKALFGHLKSKRRYYCHECLDCAKTKGSSWEYDDSAKTALLLEGSDKLECLMCAKILIVERTPCDQAPCKGNVICAESGDHTGKCHTCCSFQEEGEYPKLCV